MKKIISVIFLSIIILFTGFSSNVQAVSLDTVTLNTNKEIVNPGQEVTLNINFGKDLGSYTFDIAYDNNLLEYVSVEGGTPSDNGTRVRVAFYDSTGGTNPRSNMKITFRAKTGITTSNPTELSVTAEGLANNDASEQYDDITTPIVKNITVEPVYQDYQINLSYTGDVVQNEEKDMTLAISSSMGRYYEHARIIAEAVTPDGGQVTLKGTDEKGLEHDIIQSGWGDAQGEKIGGANVSKVLNLKGNFTKAGKYTVTIKLIDRDSSDMKIATRSFDINVVETSGTNTGDNTNQEGNTIGNEISGNQNTVQNETNNNQVQNTAEENLPETLPKTGRNIFVPIIILIVGIGITTYIVKKK